MARTASRKSTKKCPSGKHGRKAHMRKGKMIRSQCVKNRSKRTMKSITMEAMKKKKKGSKAPKRVRGTGVCTSRTIAKCSKDPRCQVKRRPRGGRTCALTRGSGIVNREAMELAGMYGA